MNNLVLISELLLLVIFIYLAIKTFPYFIGKKPYDSESYLYGTLLCVCGVPFALKNDMILLLYINLFCAASNLLLYIYKK